MSKGQEADEKMGEGPGARVARFGYALSAAVLFCLRSSCLFDVATALCYVLHVVPL